MLLIQALDFAVASHVADSMVRQPAELNLSKELVFRAGHTYKRLVFSDTNPLLSVAFRFCRQRF